MRIDLTRKHRRNEWSRRLLNYLTMLRAIFMNSLLVAALAATTRIWRKLLITRCRSRSLRVRARRCLRQGLILVTGARSLNRNRLRWLHDWNCRVGIRRWLLPDVVTRASASVSVMMMMLVMWRLMMTGCGCRNILARMHRRICVELNNHRFLSTVWFQERRNLPQSDRSKWSPSSCSWTLMGSARESADIHPSVSSACRLSRSRQHSCTKPSLRYCRESTKQIRNYAINNARNHSGRTSHRDHLQAM